MKYKGLTIIEYRDGRNRQKRYKTRFQYKNIPHNPSAQSLESLKRKIDRIFAETDDGKNPKIDNSIPTVHDCLYRTLSTIKDEKKYNFYKRVYEDFLLLMPAIRVDELTQADFYAYAELRLAKTNERTGEPIKNSTINKEFSAINVALRNAPKYFRSLNNFTPLKINKLSNDYKPRTRTVKENEFELLFAELYKPQQKSERDYDYFYRVRLGHWIEFDALTGLRRKEIALLKPEHYDSKQRALVNWRRPKTDTEVVFFPLRQRAAEIVEERLAFNHDYLFSDNGKPVESHYRKLKSVCEKLSIKYGAHLAGGFVLHDLRRNFGTEVVRSTDVKTASEMLGHASLDHTIIYLATDTERMKEAVRKMDGIDIKDDLTEIVEAVTLGKLTTKKAVEKLLKLWRSR